MSSPLSALLLPPSDLVDRSNLGLGEPRTAGIGPVLDFGVLVLLNQLERPEAALATGLSLSVSFVGTDATDAGAAGIYSLDPAFIAASAA